MGIVVNSDTVEPNWLQFIPWVYQVHTEINLKNKEAKALELMVQWQASGQTVTL